MIVSYPASCKISGKAATRYSHIARSARYNSSEEDNIVRKNSTDLVQNPLIPNLALVERVPGDRLRHLA